ncbi:MAG: hypothetical protein AB7O95_13910 [Geminicoccaceae bacterium]
MENLSRERERLAEAKARLERLEAELDPRERERVMERATVTGEVADLLDARKRLADAEAEAEVLRRFIPSQRTRISAAQDQLHRLKVRRLQVGQALQLVALNESLPALLAAIDQLRAAASPFADWSAHDLFGGETNPLLVKLNELHRYLTGNQPGDWATFMALAQRTLDGEQWAVAIAMSQPERAARPAASHGLF